ncbi:Bystin [Trema orientale]|uniref:Bystin n=1 Tax=Trema orientale TaxID=63057 RepID=A0A2P5EW46_TREOI|nr:Bystin [Trema orientale]
MARKRERLQNPQPFLAEDSKDSVASSRKRSKSREGRKQHQAEEKLLSSGMSSKILKVALIQQREVEDEDVHAQNPNNSLLTVTQDPARDKGGEDDDDDDDDIDKFAGFDETQSRVGDYERALLQEIDEEDEKLLEAFLSKDAVPQRTLADIIVAKIKERDANSLLAFVQRYKNELQKEDKDNLRALLEKQKHKLVTPEISRELNNSRSRGEKEDDLMLIDILCHVASTHGGRLIDYLVCCIFME